MGASDIKAGQAYVELALKNNQFTKGLADSGKMLRNWGGSIAAVGGSIMAASAGILGPLAACVKQFADFGSELNDMSTRTGVSAGSLAELGYAADQTGASLSDVESGLRKQAKFMSAAGKASSDQAKELRELGLEYETLKGMKPDEQFDVLAEKIGAIKNPTERAAAAMKVFGKGGTALLPMIAEMKQLRQEARDLGLAPSEAAVKAADEVGDSFSRIGAAGKAAMFNIGYALAGPILAGMKIITNIVVATGKWISQNQSLVQTVAAIGAGLLVVGGVVTGLGLSMVVAGTALSGIATGIGLIGSLLGTVLSPLGLIAVAVAAGIYIWANYTESGKAAVSGIMSTLGELLGTAQKTFGGIVDAIKAGNFALAGQIAMTGLKLVFLQGITAIGKIFGGGFANMLGTMGKKIAGGDFAGAWRTAVKGMAALWDGFAEGIVAAFTQAVRAVTELWKKTTSAISDWILKDAMAGGIIGTTALLGTGVDPKSEQARAEVTRRGDISVTQKELAQRQDELSKAKTNGGTFTDDSGTYTEEQLQRQVDDLVNHLKELDAPVNTLAEMQRDARGQLAGTADAINATMDALDRRMQERTAESEGDLAADTAGGADAEVKALEQQLAALREQAAQEAEAKATERDKAVAGEAEETKGAAGHVAGTFSAAALLAMGGGGNPMLDEAKKTNAKLDEASKKQDKLITAVQMGGLFS